MLPGALPRADILRAVGAKTWSQCHRVAEPHSRRTVLPRNCGAADSQTHGTAKSRCRNFNAAQRASAKTGLASRAGRDENRSPSRESLECRIALKLRFTARAIR